MVDELKLTEQEVVRRGKMEDLRAKGLDPFGQKFVRTSNLWQRLLRSQNRLKTPNCLSLSSPEK